MTTLIALIFSSFLFAYPEVGDHVLYQADYEGDKVLIERKLTGLDEASDVFEEVERVFYKGELIQEKTFSKHRMWYYTPEKVQNVLKTCESREGARGEWTVDGRSLQICEFYNEESMLTNIIGPVPWGQVRFQIYLGEGEEFLDFWLTKIYSTF